MTGEKRGRDIVIINQDSGYLTIDIANALHQKGFRVTLITGRLVIRNHPPDSKIKIRRIARYHRSNKLRRILSWGTGFIQLLFLIKTRHPQDNLLIVTNPPFAVFLPLLCRNSFSMMIFDVYPDALTQTGILKRGSWPVRLWKQGNGKVFARAANVFTLTEAMRSSLSEYCPAEKIKITPVWTDGEFFKPVERSKNPFVLRHSLEGKFVVLYSGNLGLTHNVEIIPVLASLVRNPEVLFVITGNGDRERWLRDEIGRRGLMNCLLLPLQPAADIPFSFASADIAMVTLGPMASGLSLPSKTFNYMSAGLPLLCIAGEDSELNRLVKKYDNGKCFVHDRVDEITAFIGELAGDKALCEHYKANSLKASLDFTPRNAQIIASEISNMF